MVILVTIVTLLIGIVVGYYASETRRGELIQTNNRLLSENIRYRRGLIRVIAGGNPVLEAELALEDVDGNDEEETK